MTKLMRIVLLVPIVLFLGWYLPVSWVNVLACDDYWHRLNVISHGFFGAQAYYWMNWEGSYVHTLFATMPHLFQYGHIPFLFNLVVLVTVALSFALLTNRCIDSKKDSLIVASYLTMIVYTFSTGAAEIRFWLCANVPYMIGISGLTILTSFCISEKQRNRKDYLLMLISLICIAGNKVSFIATAYLLIFFSMFYKKRFDRESLLLLAVLAIFALFNIIAPGNFCRLNENIANADTSFGFANVFVIRTKVLASFCSCLAFVVPIVPLFCRDLRCSSLGKGFVIAGLLILVFVVDTVVLFVCFRDPGPMRTYIILEWLLLLCSIILLAYWCQKIMKHKVGRIVTMALAVGAIMGMALHQLQLMREIPETFKFARCSRLRDSQVSSAQNGSVVDVISLPESHLLLSYFANDQVWIDNVYLPSFSADLTCGKIVGASDGL